MDFYVQPWMELGSGALTGAGGVFSGGDGGHEESLEMINSGSSGGVFDI